MNAGSAIVGTGAFLPERVVPNDRFHGSYGDNVGAIFDKTGIRARRFVDPGTSTTDLAAAAAKDALRNARIDPKTVDCLLLATSTPDFSIPAGACVVQKEIGACNALAFDLNSVCSGFVVALDVANCYVRAGRFRRVLVVGADVYSTILDFDDPKSSILFGDGAGAAVIERGANGERVLSCACGSDGTGWELICVPSSGSRAPVSAETIARRENRFRMDGRKVYAFAVKSMPGAILKSVEQAGISPEDVDVVIPHQANVRILRELAEKTGIPFDRFFLNIDRYGNTAAASVAIALHEARILGIVKPGQNVLLVGFGGGLSWNSMVWRT